MPEALTHYQNYRPFAGFLHFCFQSLKAHNNASRRASLNRAHDYLRLSSRPDLLQTHLQLNENLAQQKREWPHYDYGEGYFYQSLAELGVSGLRSTEARLNAYQLLDRVRDKAVLDIGCNAGFLSVSLAKVARHVTGFDVNPFLAALARTAAQALDRTNTEFLATGFEDAPLCGPYDVVMSLANHSTFDGQTRYNLQSFFDRCVSLLKPGGLFIFESHTPSFEGEGIAQVCGIISQRLNVKRRDLCNYGTYLDRGRTFIIAEHSKL
ncbi:MAG: class I SAM-dependent methyltransferase [Nitrobacter sp.]|uniref:class I SAM-dependent methyltransferase n=1 Tax=Nitrobacter sp. TaxID=29420 RepID=UPI00260ED602|nr:class I SAM-dependent methyltransferase [Nitrobacter sp.]MCV0387493.1 class I SAM-dependent methyltransferase [Nitrobacter sp.]